MSDHEHPQAAEPLEADDGEREPDVDPEVLARREAAMASIVQFGDPVLKSKSAARHRVR